MIHTEHNFRQGGAEWAEHRAAHMNASEASAMLGYGLHMTRTELLTLKKSGLPKQVDSYMQRILDEGHQVEAKMRTIAEMETGEEFFPITASRFVDDLPLSASYDGVNLAGTVIWECKSRNADLASSMEAGEIPNAYKPQLEQQLLVIEAEEAVFSIPSADSESTVSIRYKSDPELRKAIIAGWKQFAIDLETFEVPQPEVKAIGKTMETLPALRIELTGQVTESNLPEFKEHAIAVIKSINRELVTDQDFADADKAVKWCKEVETRLVAMKEHALSQTASIDALFRALDDIAAESRDARLALDKLVAARKVSRRAEIVDGATKKFREHMAQIAAVLGGDYMPNIPSNFPGAISGKKNFASMQNAADTELARVKIIADETSRSIALNLQSLREQADYGFLFPDVRSIVVKPADDFRNLVDKRIADHKAAEAARLERERVAREEAEEQRRIEAANPPQKIESEPQEVLPVTDEHQPASIMGLVNKAPMKPLKSVYERCTDLLDEMPTDELLAAEIALQNIRLKATT